MTDIAPISSASVGRVSRDPAVSERADAERPGRARIREGDTVEFSNTARYLTKLKSTDVRQDAVDRVRAEIEAGTYETPEKIERVIDALLEDLA
jgi:Anti-sigma-28 factor, FlgM.